MWAPDMCIFQAVPTSVCALTLLVSYYYAPLCYLSHITKRRAAGAPRATVLDVGAGYEC